MSLTTTKHTELEDTIHRLCADVPAEIPTSATLQAKVERLVATLKASRDEFQVLKTRMEQQIVDLQAKLQPKTPLEVRAQ